MKIEEKFNNNFVGSVKSIIVIKSKHSMENRHGDSVSRDHSIPNEKIMDNIKRLLKMPAFRSGKSYSIVYKNKRGFWDVMVLSYKDKYTIEIITIMKRNSRSPYDAKVSSYHNNELAIILESLNFIILE